MSTTTNPCCATREQALAISLSSARERADVISAA